MLSVVILAKNEEKNIQACLESLNFCDEILLIDDNSSDNTVELAKQAGAHVLVHKLENNFAMQRNFGLEKAKGEWVLFIDADERVSKDLAKEIQTKISSSDDTVGYIIQRFDFMKGKMLTHGETADIKLLRLAKKDSGKWVGKVHETWDVSGNIEQLENPLSHYPHQTIDEFLAEINFYTTLRAQELFAKKMPVHWYDVILYPKAKFFKNYIFKKGFLDGTEGIIMAIMMSFHSFLVRGKLWQLWDQKTS